MGRLIPLVIWVISLEFETFAVGSKIGFGVGDNFHIILSLIMLIPSGKIFRRDSERRFKLSVTAGSKSTASSYRVCFESKALFELKGMFNLGIPRDVAPAGVDTSLLRSSNGLSSLSLSSGTSNCGKLIPLRSVPTVDAFTSFSFRDPGTSTRSRKAEGFCCKRSIRCSSSSAMRALASSSFRIASDSSLWTSLSRSISRSISSMSFWLI
mmetsp:Transcript_18025/g.27015  ORF Transcript_18025/g.27015 Transcript_18025/m.27015 type:complete len:210 (-) Transcript_18025:1202-1831(-)